MAFDPNLPGIREASLTALKALLVANLAGLNAYLQRGGLWSAEKAITSAMVKDFDMKDFRDKEWAGICLFNPVETRQIRQRTTGGQDNVTGQGSTVQTVIVAYINPNTFAGNASAQEQAAGRLSDYLTDGLFNAAANRRLTLASRVYHAAPAFDALAGMIEAVEIDWFETSFGGDKICRGVECLHVGVIA